MMGVVYVVNSEIGQIVINMFYSVVVMLIFLMMVVMFVEREFHVKGEARA